MKKETFVYFRWSLGTPSNAVVNKIKGTLLKGMSNQLSENGFCPKGVYLDFGAGTKSLRKMVQVAKEYSYVAVLDPGHILPFECMLEMERKNIQLIALTNPVQFELEFISLSEPIKYLNDSFAAHILRTNQTNYNEGPVIGYLDSDFYCADSINKLKNLAKLKGYGDIDIISNPTKLFRMVNEERISKVCTLTFLHMFRKDDFFAKLFSLVKGQRLNIDFLDQVISPTVFADVDRMIEQLEH